MKRTSKTRTPEFKAEIVKRFLAGEKATTLSSEIKQHPSAIYSWVNKARAGDAPKSAGHAINGDAIRDAIIYLRHARDAMGQISKPTRSQLLTLLALSTLEGGR